MIFISPPDLGAPAEGAAVEEVEAEQPAKGKSEITHRIIVKNHFFIAIPPL